MTNLTRQVALVSHFLKRNAYNTSQHFLYMCKIQFCMEKEIKEER